MLEKGENKGENQKLYNLCEEIKNNGKFKENLKRLFRDLLMYFLLIIQQVVKRPRKVLPTSR